MVLGQSNERSAKGTAAKGTDLHPLLSGDTWVPAAHGVDRATRRGECGAKIRLLVHADYNSFPGTSRKKKGAGDQERTKGEKGRSRGQARGGL